MRVSSSFITFQRGLPAQSPQPRHTRAKENSNQNLPTSKWAGEGARLEGGLNHPVITKRGTAAYQSLRGWVNCRGHICAPFGTWQSHLQTLNRSRLDGDLLVVEAITVQWIHHGFFRNHLKWFELCDINAAGGHCQKSCTLRRGHGQGQYWINI